MVTLFFSVVDDGEAVDVLQDVDVKVINNDKCNEMLFKVSGAIEVDDNMLCAGHFQGVKDACQVRQKKVEMTKINSKNYTSFSTEQLNYTYTFFESKAVWYFRY